MVERKSNKWQERALANIHVIDKPGEWGTCVYILGNNFLRPVSPIPSDQGYYARVYPITAFDPQNEQALPKRLDPQLVMDIRLKLQQNRPKGHAFTSTPEEQLKMDRIFIELAKYPEISHLAFGEESMVILAGDDNFSEFSKKKRALRAGDYTSWLHRTRIMDICFENQDDLRSVVLEELLHGICSKHSAKLGLRGADLTPVYKMTDIITLAEALEPLRNRNNCSIGSFLPGKKEAMLAQKWRVGKYLLEATTVYTEEVYRYTPKETHSEELYVKLMKGLVRSAYRKEELAEFFLSTLNIPEVPGLAAGLRSDHNLLLASYRDTVLLPERIKGDLYAESVAKRLEAEGIQTGYFGRGRG